MRRDLVAALAAGLLVLAATGSFERVFADGAWLPLAWSSIGIALAVAVVARALRIGTVPATIASFVFWVVYVYVTQLTADGLVPGIAQAREFVDIWRAGMSAAATEPTPARTLPELLLLVSSGCWWVTHATHEVLVRARRPGLAIIITAVLWIVPLAPPQAPGRTWPYALPFLAAAGIALLLEPAPDLTGLDDAVSARDDRRPLSLGAGGAIGAIVLLVAVLVPGVLPGYGAEPLVDLQGPNAARGYQPIVDVSQRLKLPEPRDLLYVRTSRPLYLRLAGLETFDGNVWRLGPQGAASFAPEDVSPADRPLPVETPINESTTVEAAIDNLSLENVFVPVPYHPVRVTGEAAGRMVYSQDGSFVATSDVLEDEPALLPGLSYGVVSRVPDATPEQLRSVGPDVYDTPEYDRWRGLPGAYPELAEVTTEILAQADARSPYDVAFALQDFFRGDLFEYSTDVAPLRSSEALTRFVTETRRGYCEYYATAMAVMLRLEGIPSRVAVGFRTGEKIQPGEYVVTTEDAHAWVEVLFPGYGWIQFEPTPALGDALVPRRDDVTPEVPVASAHPADPATEEPTESSTAPEGADPGQPQLPDEPAQDGAQQRPASSPWPLRLLAAALISVAIAALAVAASRRQLHDGLPGGEAGVVLLAQRRLLAGADSLGVGRRPDETLSEVAERWIREERVDPDRMRRFVEVAQTAAFGGLLERSEGAKAQRLAGLLLGELEASVPPVARLTAPVRGTARGAMDTSLDVLGRMTRK